MEATTNTFVPDLWDTDLQKSLKDKLIFAKWTDKKYEGTLAEAGDQVRINTIGTVAVTHLDYSVDEDRKKFENNLGEPQGMTKASVTLQVNQIVYYQIQDSDLAKKLAKIDTWSPYKEEAADQMASEIDKYIASKATDKALALYSSSITTIDVNNITKVLTKMNTMIRKKNVTGELKMEVPYEFIDILHEAYEKAQSNNEELMKSGKVTSAKDVGTYHQMIFEASNNVYYDTTNSCYYGVLRTKNAIASVNRCTGSEMIRSSNGFSDILRGYTLYDAKVIKPVEALVIKFKLNADTEKYVLTKAQAA